MKGNSNTIFIWVETATPGTYALPKGQDNLKRTRSAEKSETTTKDTTGSKTWQYYLGDTAYTVDFIPDLPDTAYTRLETASRTKLPINIQVRTGGTASTGTSDVIFACSMYVEETSFDAARNSPAKTSFELSPAAAPTTDALAF